MAKEDIKSDPRFSDERTLKDGELGPTGIVKIEEAGTRESDGAKLVKITDRDGRVFIDTLDSTGGTGSVTNQEVVDLLAENSPEGKNDPRHSEYDGDPMGTKASAPAEEPEDANVVNTDLGVDKANQAKADEGK